MNSRIKPILTSLTLVLAMVLTFVFHDTIEQYYVSNHVTHKVDIGWGLMIKMIPYIYIGIMSICWLTDLFIGNRKSKYWIYLIGLLLFYLIISTNFQYRPLRTLLVAISAGIGPLFMIVSNLLSSKLRGHQHHP